MGILDWAKKINADREKGLGFKASVTYLGGHPRFLQQTSGVLTTKPEGLEFGVVFKGNFLIPYKAISTIEADTAERLSIGRMLLVGIFAFAWKKKDKFLKVTYKDETGFESNVIFGKLDAEHWRSVIMRARQTITTD